MRKPTIAPVIEKYRDSIGNIYELWIPDVWVRNARFPKLLLTWWLLKLAWSERKEK